MTGMIYQNKLQLTHVPRLHHMGAACDGIRFPNRLFPHVLLSFTTFLGS
jgi:hypothetical protein